MQDNFHAQSSFPSPMSWLKSKKVLVFSAHCDDALIGCGGTLRRIQKETSDTCEIIPVVFSRGMEGETEEKEKRGREEEEAMKMFGIQSPHFYDIPDSGFPDHWFEIKKIMLQLRNTYGENLIDLIFCPRLEDRHQDHRVVAENVWRIFRKHLIVEYEIAKYEGDLGTPNIYVGLDQSEAEFKVNVLMEAYKSRTAHHWWSPETFNSLMHLRGIESNNKFAEGLYVRKLMI